MSVGVMEDYKLRDLRASHTLGYAFTFCFFCQKSFFFSENTLTSRDGKNTYNYYMYYMPTLTSKLFLSADDNNIHAAHMHALGIFRSLFRFLYLSLPRAWQSEISFSQSQDKSPYLLKSAKCTSLHPWMILDCNGEKNEQFEGLKTTIVDSRPKAASQVDGSWEISVMQKLAGGSSQTAGAAKQAVIPSLPGYNLSKNVVGGPLVRQTFGSDYGPETYNVGVSFCLKKRRCCLPAFALHM
jgi:hypothetical protein